MPRQKKKKSPLILHYKSTLHLSLPLTVSYWYAELFETQLRLWFAIQLLNADVIYLFPGERTPACFSPSPSQVILGRGWRASEGGV